MLSYKRLLVSFLTDGLTSDEIALRMYQNTGIIETNWLLKTILCSRVKIVITKSLRQDMINAIHVGHFGVEERQDGLGI
jgi:hypothetical protein